MSSKSATIHPAFNDAVTVCFGTDENYLPYLEVAIRSLIQNCNKELNYDIVILNSGLKDKQDVYFKNLINQHISIRFVSLEDFILDYKHIFYEKDYFSIAMYYRLFIPKLFCHFEKVLYLDCDIIINDDISLLFKSDLEDKALGAVLDIVMQLALKRQNMSWELPMIKSAKQAGIKNLEQYFNSGVLLYDIQKSLELDVLQKALKLLKKHKRLHFVDQDLLNTIFEDNVKYLPIKWNFLWTLIEDEDRIAYICQDLLKQYHQASERPSLIHYISSNKPWVNRYTRYAYIWWKYARTSPYYAEILYKNLKFQDEYFYKLCENAKVVSFDIFDTLLLRPYVNAHGVFEHLEQCKNAKGFTQNRIKAEELAAQKFNKTIFELNFDEIYECMPEKFLHLKEIEKELELQTLYVNKEMKIIYDYVLKLGKKVILTTDMYHSKEFLKKILDKNNIISYDKLYISNEMDASKALGTIYPLIAKDQNVETSQIVHIGDNINSDYKCALNEGIGAFFCASATNEFFKRYPRFNSFNELYQNSSVQIILGLLIKKWLNEDKDLENYWDYFGYFYGGALCYGLAKFVHDHAIKDDLKEFIFVARDGFVIEKIFNLLQNLYHTHIKTHYIYAPRAVNLALSLDIENSAPWDDKLSGILSLYKDDIVDFQNIDKNASKKKKQEIFQKNFSKLKQLAQKAKQSYQKYISSFDIQGDKIGMFDTTTLHFSAAKLLSSYLGKNLKECYFLIVDKNNKRQNTVEYTKNKYYFKNNCICEFLISAPELSCKGFDDDLKPIRINNKFERYKNKIYKIVSKAEIDFSKDLLETFKKFEVNFDSKVLIDLINFMTEEPDARDLWNFRNVYHAGDSAHQIYQKVLAEKKTGHYGAAKKVKNQLSYRVGKTLLKAKNPLYILILPFALMMTIKNFKSEQRLREIMIKYDASLESIPLEYYADYEEGMKVKKQLTYKLGNAFIKNPLTFIFKIFSIHREWKNG